MGNHRSNMDLVTYGAICPQKTIGIGKKELLYIPLLGFFFHCADLLLIDRSNKEKAIESLDYIAKKLVEKGMSVGVMPEGTRNKTDERLLPFKKGPFHLALKSSLPIVPVISSPVQDNFDWKRKALYGGTLRFTILEPVYPKDFASSENPVEELKEHLHKLILDAYIDLEKRS
jgi:lysophosphatidate acyltransferase